MKFGVWWDTGKVVVDEDPSCLDHGLCNKLLYLARYLSLAQAEVQSTDDIIVLPCFYGFGEQHGRVYHVGSLFNIGALSSALWADLRIRVVDSRLRRKVDRDGSLAVVRLHYNRTLLQRGPVTQALLKGLAPSIPLAEARAQCAARVREQLGVGDYVAVHLRVERDFLAYCLKRERLTGQRHCFHASDVLPQVTRSLPDTRRILVIGDIASMAEEERVTALEGWPSGYRVVSTETLGCLSSRFRYIHRAAMDFFLALDASAFVGLTSSTFSNAVMSTRQLHRSRLRPSTPPHNYVYNCAKYHHERLVPVPDARRRFYGPPCDGP